MAEILSLPPNAICILWKSLIPSWPDDAEQNKSVIRATETERCGRDGDTLLAMDTTPQDSVPRKMWKPLFHFRNLPMLFSGPCVQGFYIRVIGVMAMLRQQYARRHRPSTRHVLQCHGPTSQPGS